MVQKGGVKSLLLILTKSIDIEAQRFAALALGNISSAGNSTSCHYARKNNRTFQTVWRLCYVRLHQSNTSMRNQDSNQGELLDIILRSIIFNRLLSEIEISSELVIILVQSAHSNTPSLWDTRQCCCHSRDRIALGCLFVEGVPDCCIWKCIAVQETTISFHERFSIICRPK